MTAKNGKPKRGRPITRKIEKINATPEEIARAMFKAAARKMEERMKETVWFRI